MSLNTPVRPATPVALMLTGGRVTAAFRSALFDAADREGMSVNEYVLRSAAEKLARRGGSFPGVFPSDCKTSIEADAA